MITWSTFVAIAKEETKDVTEAYGFSIDSEKCPFVRFANGEVEISLYFDAHGRREFDVGFRKVNSGSGRFVPSIGIGSLLSKKGIRYCDREFLQITSEVEARSELRRAVNLIQTHLKNILQGDSSCLEADSRS